MLVDPHRLRRHLAWKQNGVSVAKTLSKSSAGLSDHVHYIFDKQLEEAEVVVMNKADLLSDEHRSILEAYVRHWYPDRTLHTVSLREQTNVAAWWEMLLAEESRARPIEEIDYARYAAGEALLGWLNAEYLVARQSSAGSEKLDGDALIRSLCEVIKARSRSGRIEIAHLKVSVTDADQRQNNGEAIGIVQCVGTGAPLEDTSRMNCLADQLRVTVNLRAESHPEILSRLLKESIGDISGPCWQELSIHCFAPLPPKPLHRIPRDSANTATVGVLE